MRSKRVSDLVAGQRAGVKRRAIAFNCALIAIGVMVNQAFWTRLGQKVAALLIYTGLIVLSVQCSGKWFLRPGDLKEYLLRHWK